jgi:hypothetical protein
MIEKAHCFHCKKQVSVKNAKWEIDSRGQPMVKATCATCGGNVAARVAGHLVPADVKKKAEAYKKSHPSSRKTQKKTRSGGRQRNTRSNSRSKK